MTSIKHDIWEHEEGTMLCYSGELGEESRTLLEPNSKIVHSFYAESHFEAMTKYYKYMGWGVYEAEFEIDQLPYDEIELQKRAKLRFSIDQILWNDWDPIGVNDVAPRDEYQTYVQQILNMALNNSSIQEIADRLYFLETETMGLLGNKGRCFKIAGKIKSQM